MADNTVRVDESATHKVFEHHLEAFAEGIDALMADYADDSVITTPTGNHVGKAEIRAFFEKFLEEATPEFWAAFKVGVQYVKDDIAYLTWSAEPFMPLATDTLLVRNNRIWIQTFTPFAL
ncbi:nuclear transport factor 2 family protein [Marinobacter salinexigens]|jgi:ketosteroid isomerase-like protein|uniref:Nuclear transport factor 2 family protein n=1 Tax=Marinobacter salinexigens TaxID=2919747 RepID=A0A5B0VGR0_9GAMM|nr:nuclear transport factor 2 family protein [Marinobacter salinexigens]KAA1173269.1 nuclear transport factor 2 family protein [Marinobacter salinexigens]|tara:strand:- start:589 stop:948 length:360 start_codon:yes stop_codon:yes gene_type:complete